MRNRPIVSLYESYFKAVFHELSSSRDHTESGYPKSIPISEIRSYCEMFYISGLDERTTLTRLIQAMDHAYIEVRNEQVSARLAENAKNPNQALPG